MALDLPAGVVHLMAKLQASRQAGKQARSLCSTSLATYIYMLACFMYATEEGRSRRGSSVVRAEVVIDGNSSRGTHHQNALAHASCIDVRLGLYIGVPWLIGHGLWRSLRRSVV